MRYALLTSRQLSVIVNLTLGQTTGVVLGSRAPMGRKTMLEPHPNSGRMPQPVRLALGALLALIASLALLQLTAPNANAAGLDLQSKAGISVGGQGWIPDGSSDRQIWQADISTSLIDPKSINGGVNRVRILVPDNYFTSPSARYPVLYLLHGGAGGSSRQWTTEGGAAGYITAGKPVITVMAEGGKVGWFTNWVNQTKGPQRWADFYETQLIPFIDQNLRTIATKQGRAIGGLSMGGYGAVRIAQDRPDLFQAVASFSGALDLQNGGTQLVICEQAIEAGYGCNDPFGSTSTQWKKWDPISRGGAMFKNQNLMILLYAGSGINDVDVLERTMGDSTYKFNQMLNKAGITNMFWMYGRPGPSAPFGCDGGHNFSCWNFALNDALPRMLPYLAQATNQQPPPPPPPPQPVGTNVVVNGGFENGQSPWACGGNCGRDGAGNARTGNGNGWVRNSTGWNNIYQTVGVDKNRNYRVTGWIRTSANNTDGYFGVRSTGGAVVGERKYGRFDGYTQIQFDVNSGNNAQLQVYAGLWANGDTWAQIDDVSVTAL
jgi:S-formylglutathione hydrolase FrmB